MAVDKLVDSTQLDSDLTSVANAIRAKSGGSSQLAFPAGFVSEIGNIPSGGGYTKDDFLDPSKPTGSIVSDVAMSTQLGYSAIMKRRTGITSVFLSEATFISDESFQNCSNLLTFVAPKAKTVGTNTLGTCNALTSVDIGGASGSSDGIKRSAFNASSNLNCLILRQTSVIKLDNVNAFSGTKFASGGAGGTIYIPKSLYDHLGDGTANDYKAASNWTTMDGYGTITWAKIEGTTYETHYVDGTAIPT